MNPTISPGSSSAVSSGHFLHCSVLSRNMGCSHNIIPSWERDVPCTLPRMKPRCRLVNFSGVQRSREPSSKHFLSEEKMAARFNSLSLDNDHIYSTNGFPVHSESPGWQQACTQLKELQRRYQRAWQLCAFLKSLLRLRLSQDGASDETNCTEEELTTVIVDGEFTMGDCPMLVPSSFTNPCTEVVLWSPHSNSLLHTIRTLMAPSSAQPHLEVVANQEEMEI
ncbi:hypothetical protein E2320_003287 [Naja naja]|nr:hypothetical protein E2320_003287 [Naja naja]